MSFRGNPFVSSLLNDLHALLESESVVAVAVQPNLAFPVAVGRIVAIDSQRVVIAPLQGGGHDYPGVQVWVVRQFIIPISSIVLVAEIDPKEVADLDIEAEIAKFQTSTGGQ